MVEPMIIGVITLLMHIIIYLLILFAVRNCFGALPILILGLVAFLLYSLLPESFYLYLILANFLILIFLIILALHKVTGVALAILLAIILIGMILGSIVIMDITNVKPVYSTQTGSIPAIPPIFY